MASRSSQRDTGIYAVAAQAGVSVMSVSRAMRGIDGVSKAKREEILAIAQRLNYVPNSNAKALSQTNADLIGISVPTLFNNVFADILNGMRGTIQRAGYSTLFDTSEYDPSVELQWVTRMLSWRPAALVLTGVDHHPDVRYLLRDAKIPTLEIWDHSDDPIDICVGIDHFAAGKKIGSFIRKLGYRRPAYVGVTSGKDKRSDSRALGIEDAFQSTIHRTFAKHDNAFKMGATATNQLMSEYQPDVVFYLNDHLAFGGLTELQHMGYAVPQDIGVVGFNALDINTVMPVPMTTVRTPRRLMGITGARNLLARLNGVAKTPAIDLPVEIFEGATTRLQDHS